MKTPQSILFHHSDTALFQIVSCYLNLTNFRLIGAVTAKDLFLKLDRQKFAIILVGTESEQILNDLLASLARKDSMNHGSPLLLLNNRQSVLQFDERFSPHIKGVIDSPFTLASLHQSLLLNLASQLL